MDPVVRFMAFSGGSPVESSCRKMIKTYVIMRNVRRLRTVITYYNNSSQTSLSEF